MTMSLITAAMLGKAIEQHTALHRPGYVEATERALRSAVNEPNKEVRVWYDTDAELALTVATFDKTFAACPGTLGWKTHDKDVGVYVYELLNGSALVLGTKSDEARYLASLEQAA